MHKTLAYYEDNAKYLSKEYESAKVDHIHQLLLNTFTPNSYLLEIGCGSGRDASFIYRNDFDILATDGSREMVEEAKKYHPELKDRLKVINIPNELHFKPSSFDGVYSIATLMHLKKDSIDITFGKIAKILKPDGKLVFSVSINRDDVNQQHKDKQERHFTMITEAEWIQYCEKHNLEVEHSEISNDGLNRNGIVWLTCIARKRKLKL